jgi:hypothetical protein
MPGQLDSRLRERWNWDGTQALESFLAAVTPAALAAADRDPTLPWWRQAL